MDEDAGKAKIIWNHTFSGRRSLTTDQADILANKIGWLVTHFKTDIELISGNGDGERIAKLKKTQKHASALLNLLSDEQIKGEITRHYFFDYNLTSIANELYVPTINELIRGLEALQIAICSKNSNQDSALAEANRKAGRKPPKGSSSLDRFIYSLADLYEVQSGERAGVSRVGDQTEMGGPFVRFVKATTEKYELTAPRGQTIASALRKRKRPVPPPKHVIGALKL